MPAPGQQLRIAHKKRIVAETDVGITVGNLPTAYNYLAACLKMAGRTPARHGFEWLGGRRQQRRQTLHLPRTHDSTTRCLYSSARSSSTLRSRRLGQKTNYVLAASPMQLVAFGARRAFRAAVVIPSYLEKLTRDYFAKLGCVELSRPGNSNGAPNITLFSTRPRWRTKSTTHRCGTKRPSSSATSQRLWRTRRCADISGTFSLADVCAMLPTTARLHVDVAYDVETPKTLAELNRSIETVSSQRRPRCFKTKTKP